MKAPLSISQSVNQNHFFSKTADRIFIKFHTNFWNVKEKKVIQPGKNLIFGKKAEISLKVGFFGVGKKFVLGFTFTIFVFMISQKPHVLRKSLSQVIYENSLGQSDCHIF